METIASVTRNENAKLANAMRRDGMTFVGTLRDIRDGKLNSDQNALYLWLGGFDRFTRIGYVDKDWWVHEKKSYGSSWCCCPDDPVYGYADQH